MQIAPIVRRPIFWQRRIARSQLDCAMRKSRQRRCSAANSHIIAGKTPKLLDRGRNFSRAIFGAFAPGRRCLTVERRGWHQVEQSMLAA
jgi:hypothetical protein